MIIVGDVHSCGYELEKIIHDNKGERVLLCGDLFDRGFDGVKVWELINEFNLEATLGNHELKMLEFLNGKRQHLPSHYCYFLNSYIQKYKLEDLVAFLEKMPLIIKINESSLLTHASVVIDDPFMPNVSANVYGRHDKHDRLKNMDRTEWLDHYHKDVFVYYGHKVFPKPHFTKNTLGLDTGACHGFGLSYVNTETKSVKTIPSKDYFKQLKSKVNINTVLPEIQEFIKKNAKQI